jgi:hypothetical protein
MMQAMHSREVQAVMEGVQQLLEANHSIGDAVEVSRIKQCWVLQDQQDTTFYEYPVLHHSFLYECPVLQHSFLCECPVLQHSSLYECPVLQHSTCEAPKTPLVAPLNIVIILLSIFE